MRSEPSPSFPLSLSAPSSPLISKELSPSQPPSSGLRNYLRFGKGVNREECERGTGAKKEGLIAAAAPGHDAGRAAGGKAADPVVPRLVGARVSNTRTNIY